MNAEQQRLVERLCEGELSLNRFFTVKYNKQPGEPKGYTEHLRTPDEMDKAGITNWGIHGGHYLVLLDSDTPQMYELLSKVIPATFEVTSPRRKVPHKYLIVCGVENVGNYEFHIEGVFDEKDPSKLAKCGEVRTQNQYLMAPGSQVWLDAECTKLGTYKISKDVPLARMELADFMKAIEPYIGKVNGVDQQKLTTEDMKNGVVAGSRHRKCVRYADLLLGSIKLDKETAKHQLLNWNLKNNPPLSEADIDHCLEEAIGFIAKQTGIPEAQVAANGAIKNPCLTPEEIEAMKPEMLAGNLEVQCEQDLALVNPIPVVLEKGTHIAPACVADDILSTYSIVTDIASKTLYFYQKKQGIYNKNGEVILEKIIDKTLHVHNTPTLSSQIITLVKIKTYTETTVSKKLAMANGLFDLETGKLSDFTPNEFCINKFEVAYIPEATCQEWLDFIDRVCHEDKLLLQEWSGYLLVRGYPFHAIMWLYGPMGRNGKGVWARTMIGILGEANYSSVSIDEFDGKHRFALYNLKDSLFNISPEPRTDRDLTIELLQSLSGQDPIDAESKRIQARFRFTNPAKITVMGNKFPTIKAPTEAFWARLKLCKFPIRIPDNEQIQDLEKKWLDDPIKKSAIFNWMLEGYKRLMAQKGFTLTTTQEKTILQFKRASDTVGAWFMEAVTFDSNEVVLKTEAFEHYKKYCENLGIPSTFLNDFADKLRNHQKVKDTSTRIGGKKTKVWGGFKLKEIVDTDSDEDDDKPPKTKETVQAKLGENGTSGTTGTTSHTQPEESDLKNPIGVSTEGSSNGSSGSKETIYFQRVNPAIESHRCDNPGCPNDKALLSEFKTKVQLEDQPRFNNAEFQYFCNDCFNKRREKAEKDGVTFEYLPGGSQ